MLAANDRDCDHDFMEPQSSRYSPEVSLLMARLESLLRDYHAGGIGSASGRGGEPSLERRAPLADLP